MVSDPKFLEFLLGTTRILDKSDDYTFLSRWLGTGLLTSGSKSFNCGVQHNKNITSLYKI